MIKEPELIKTEFDGKQARIIDSKHPHYNAIATCMGAEFVSGLGKYGMRFKRLDTNEEFFVFDGKQTRWI